MWLCVVAAWWCVASRWCRILMRTGRGHSLRCSCVRGEGPQPPLLMCARAGARQVPPLMRAATMTCACLLASMPAFPLQMHLTELAPHTCPRTHVSSAARVCTRSGRSSAGRRLCIRCVFVWDMGHGVWGLAGVLHTRELLPMATQRKPSRAFHALDLPDLMLRLGSCTLVHSVVLIMSAHVPPHRPSSSAACVGMHM